MQVGGYKVLTALGGREGMAVLSARHVDGVIVDYEMPEKTGGAVAREIKRLYPNLPVLMLSGYGRAISKSELAAVDILLDKSTFPEKLLIEISMLLEKFAPALPARKKPVQKVRHRKAVSKRKA